MMYKKTKTTAKPLIKGFKAGIKAKSQPMTGPKTMPARKMLLGGRKPSSMAGKAKRR